MATAERPLRKDAERNRRRILDAAAELFTERGLGVTLNDIAHHADVGVGTVYRRFPSKELLIDALFEERLEEFAALAEQALADTDPWRSLVGFLERSLELQTRDKGLKELLLGTPEGCARVGELRERVIPLAAALVDRARDAGVLRADIEAGDLAAIQWMVVAVAEHTRAAKPDVWRRYLALLLSAVRAGGGQTDEPLPVAPLTTDEVGQLMESRAAGRR